ncbi:hypothetical protein NL676_014670 [Syzygium grande]|nr:hypothetical protein NL676_014670 [Syzygium grande]
MKTTCNVSRKPDSINSESSAMAQAFPPPSTIQTQHENGDGQSELAASGQQERPKGALCLSRRRFCHTPSSSSSALPVGMAIRPLEKNWDGGQFRQSLRQHREA